MDLTTQLLTIMNNSVTNIIILFCLTAQSCWLERRCRYEEDIGWVFTTLVCLDLALAFMIAFSFWVFHRNQSEIGAFGPYLSETGAFWMLVLLGVLNAVLL